MDKIFLLEYNEKSGDFHYNLMDYVRGTRGFKAISLCSYEIASDFTQMYRNVNLSYDEICQRWETYFNNHRNEFLKIGLK